MERRVYRKKGVWNFTTLEYDLEACGGAGFGLEGHELFAELVRLNGVARGEGLGVKA